jgi:RNA polymerase sigma factor (sigma-70 family)
VFSDDFWESVARRAREARAAARAEIAGLERRLAAEDEAEASRQRSALASRVPSEEPDDDLVVRASGGEEEAWSALVGRFSGLVWSVIRGYRMSAADAADASQTTWLRLAEHLHKGGEPERIGAWLATTAGRECLRIIRQNQRALETGSDALLAEIADADPAAAPETQILAQEENSELWEAFSELPPSAQQLLRLLFADPAPSYEEISAATGLPIGSIGPIRGRYLAHLRKHFETGQLDASKVQSALNPRPSSGQGRSWIAIQAVR